MQAPQVRVVEVLAALSRPRTLPRACRSRKVCRPAPVTAIFQVHDLIAGERQPSTWRPSRGIDTAAPVSPWSSPSPPILLNP